MAYHMETITMTTKELRRLQVINRLIQKDINGTTAARLLNISIRQTKRLKSKVLKRGDFGIIHGSRGQPGNRKISTEIKAQIIQLLKEKYIGFKPTFATEKLREIHGLIIGTETVRQIMINNNLWQPRIKKANKKHRKRRARKECFGEMQQYDGSYHNWFEDRAEKCCLLASIDDATGKLYLQFEQNEGVIPTFNFWRAYIERYGKPQSIYVDRYSTYHVNYHRIDLLDKEHLTEWQRAMTDLNINIIFAGSPQAKGRVERLFNTLQDRLVKELRLANISSVAKANKWLEKKFIPDFNNRFAVVPIKPDNMHSKVDKTERHNLDRIFSIQEKRMVTNDYTISYQKQCYQLLKKQPIAIYPKDIIMVETRPDQTIKLSLRGYYLNYEILPAKPLKVSKQKDAKANSKSLWKPPLSHPWKRGLIGRVQTPKYDTSILQEV
jgi:hypothetical protein